MKQYNNKTAKILIFAFILISLFLINLGTASAQGLNATSQYEIADKNAVDGDILIFTNQGLVRTDIPYSNAIFGVLDKGALIVIDTGETNQQPVISTGTASVNITTAGGPIKKGDKITTSTTPGKGQKAVSSGYVLGVALADFNEAAGKMGRIPVAIKIEYAETTSARSFMHLFDAIGGNLFQSAQDPRNFGQVIRYIIAGMIALTGFGTSFVLFSRSVSRSIEAIGRNPLAKGSIFTVVWINVLLAVLVTLIGTGAAIFIIRV